VATAAHAHEITSPSGNNVKPDFDIVSTTITTNKNVVTFRMEVSGKAGATVPTPSGKLAGSDVFSYVWPTSIDSSEVGFDKKAGILAFAVTSHPDFDDTPLFDENGDSLRDNDGNLWHSHWVVLVPDDACGKGSLKVKDIPNGAKPRLPRTWPGLPILIDSPGYTPVLSGPTVEVNVPFDNIAAVKGQSFDGVTSGLRVNASVHAPLLCIANVFDIASGKLTLPGKIR